MILFSFTGLENFKMRKMTNVLFEMVFLVSIKSLYPNKSNDSLNILISTSKLVIDT